MKYIAYIRKSSEDKKRQIQSIPRQYEWCKNEADRRGFKISRFFEDSNSAHKLHRRSFNEMIEAIEESEEPIGIITWKISRLSRNPIDEGVIKYAFIRGKIKNIIARDREYKEHESQIIMGVDFGQATQFSIELSKDVKEGMNKKVSNGHRPTKAPYGYINDPTGLKGEKRVFIDEKYFKPIQLFLKSYATGIYSISELQEKLRNQGVFARSDKPFSLSTLYIILKRRFYCGEFLWNGKIISEEVTVKLFTNWPDFVFADNYKLESLENIETYISNYNHLPGVPSAKQVEEKGINLGEMNAILLQKIEELMLYTIKQQKMIEKQVEVLENQQKQIDELKTVLID